MAHTEKPPLPEGAYWYEESSSEPPRRKGRYITPSEPSWKATEYESVTGQKLGACRCGKSPGVAVLFSSVHSIEDDELPGRNDVAVICGTCAEAAGGFAKKQFGG